ncbi:MAG: pyridoxal-phosphate dependent enzyme [Ignavibacteria bacterium]|nr:pyridoxal-phosphate dependent enzyme [Ignavibacteria bacterium]
MKALSLNYSILPTPLHKLENLSSLLNMNIYCKRDDLTGFAFGGNKTRKLDYLIAEAKLKDMNTLVAVGGFQSNFCRLAAAYGAKENIEVHLILGGKKKPLKLTANLMLDKMLGAKIFFVESENWNLWEKTALKKANELKRKGKKVYWMPIGGSNSTGVLGYVDCMKEIKDYEINKKICFDYIIHATASAGTQSGLIIGKQLYKWSGTIIGIAVTKNTNQLFDEVWNLSTQTAPKFNLSVNPFHIKVDSNFIGKGYAHNTTAAKEAIKLFLKYEGIPLDNVYSGKAASALIHYARNNFFPPGKNILFLHTGGSTHLFR